MRHRKHTFKVGRDSSHRRCLIANLLKDLVLHERIETTVPKAKELRRYADRLITLAKKHTLASQRRAKAMMMIRFNPLTSKEKRKAKEGNTAAYNSDRLALGKLFDQLGKRFLNRQGGYTRIIKKELRIGDHASKCIIEYLKPEENKA
ncbi:MAG: 50S ribosomal protein L17 [Parachlamydiales bacterium]|nr:50S ribosomal protein L17 [Parachlamydiales bacterium]